MSTDPDDLDDGDPDPDDGTPDSDNETADPDEFEDRNVYGGDLAPCSHDPETGYLRDGHCRDVDGDVGRHQLCVVLTEGFLEYSHAQGNDLITPRPEFDFPGLEPDDCWCVCVDRWLAAVDDETAPPVILEATSESVLTAVDPETLREHEYERE